MDSTSEKSIKNHAHAELHWEIQNWRTKLRLIAESIDSIEQILNSFSIETYYPRTFVQMGNYSRRILHTRATILELHNAISKHEIKLGVMIFFSEVDFSDFYQNHAALCKEVIGCSTYIQDLTSEILRQLRKIL